MDVYEGYFCLRNEVYEQLVYIMQQKQLVQQLMFGVRMNRETAGSKQQSFNATDIKNVSFMQHIMLKSNHILVAELISINTMKK